jgi:hypothetical protein
VSPPAPPGRVHWPDADADADGDPPPDLDAYPAPTTNGRRALPWLLVAVTVAIGTAPVAWVALVVAHTQPATLLAPVAATEWPVAAGPGTAAAGASRPTTGPARVDGWARSLAPRLGIPATALAAYGSAELDLTAERPDCHLSWVALAGIGGVESAHGSVADRVIGVALNGDGVAEIRDTDDGRLDGDTTYDRAVGPMQFLPSTWGRWGSDGDGDGRADPFSYPDAALAAGRYLCASGGGDLRDAGPWSRAVLAYNRSTTYLRKVTDVGNGYAARSRPG